MPLPRTVLMQSLFPTCACLAWTAFACCIRFMKYLQILCASLLTGNADQQTAIDAVNEGHIFRFLTKPCSPEILAKSLCAGLEQYRLICVEKTLLEKTLVGSVQLLSDVLTMLNPLAFSRAS